MHICGKRYVDRAEDVTKVTVYSNQPEVELFAGTIVRLAQRHGLDVPVNRWLYETVKRMEAAY